MKKAAGAKDRAGQGGFPPGSGQTSPKANPAAARAAAKRQALRQADAAAATLPPAAFAALLGQGQPGGLLLTPPPQQVTIEDRPWSIRADFRISIAFELLLQDRTLSDSAKAKKALALYYPVLPGNVQQAVSRLLWFYRCGEEPTAPAKATAAAGAAAKGRVYHFAYDGPYFYAAFLSQYGIDLLDVPFLHWWKFKALFRALDSECQLMKIMGYRAMPLSPELTREQRRHYQHLKALYALPDLRSEAEKERDFGEALACLF